MTTSSAGSEPTDQMQNARALLPAGFTLVDRRVHAVPADRWAARTPCRDWSVRDVLAHLVTEHRWAAYLLTGGSVAAAGDRFDGDPLGADPVAAWDRARAMSQAAWTDVSDDTQVQLSRGATPAGAYAQEMLLDLAVHGWDLARGAGLAERLDPEVVAAVLGIVRSRAGELTGGALFAAPVESDSDDPQDQLLALLGRDPR